MGLYHQCRSIASVVRTHGYYLTEIQETVRYTISVNQ